MAEEFSVFGMLSWLGMALSHRKFPLFCLKPLQVKFFEHTLKGLDVIAVLPTGFAKSLLFQLLPDFLPVKGEKNIVLIVCPLNSMIEDQLKVLEERGISADVLQFSSHMGKFDPPSRKSVCLCKITQRSHFINENTK